MYWRNKHNDSCVSGGSGTISYQWQSSADGTTGWANALGTGSTQPPLHLQVQ
jgi:hypothetical protein